MLALEKKSFTKKKTKLTSLEVRDEVNSKV